MNAIKTTTFALAAMLLGTSFANAGGLHIPGLGGSESATPEIFNAAERDNTSPNFQDIFNPQPEPQIGLNSELVDRFNLDPQIEVIDLGLGQGGATKPGKQVKLNAGVKLGAALKCVVSGTPSEFPDDLRIANAGVVALPAGTHFKWKVQGVDGVASLGKTLAPGKSIKLSNVLPGGAEAGTVCSARAIGL